MATPDAEHTRTHPPPDLQQPGWTQALFVLLAGGCIVVPCIFATRVHSVFAVPKLTALWVLLALSFGVVAVGALLSDTLPISARPLLFVDGAVLALIALSLAAWVFSIDRRQSLYGEHLQHQGLLTLLLYVGFFYLARLAMIGRWRLRTLSWTVAIGATLVSGYALVQKAGLDPIWHGWLPGGRVFSSIGQANALAAYLVLAIPLAAALAIAARRGMRSIAVLATAAMVVAFVFTQSRGGYLGLCAALIVLAVGLRRGVGMRSQKLAAAAAVVAVGVALVALARPPATAGAFPRVALRGDASIRFHLDAWRVAWEIVTDHPVLGTGQETFPEIFPRYSHEVLPPQRAAALDAFRVESPHNDYLAVAAGSGVPALIAYLAIIAGFVATVVKALTRASQDARIALIAVLAAVTGHLVTDAFMTAEITGSWLFWLLMGATLGWIIGMRDQDPGDEV